MRTIEIMVDPSEEIIRLYATRGRKHWYALIEQADGTYRMQGDGCMANYGNNVDRVDAVGDIESRIAMAKQIDLITYRPIETSSAIRVNY